MKTNKNDSNKTSFIGTMKASFSGRKFRSGAYTTVVSAIVIVMILVVNLIVTKMNIQVDLSSNSMYTISNETKSFLKDLKDDITIYYMVQQGNEQEVYQKIANQYVKQSDKITLEKKDPVLYPQFASQYVTDEVTENSFIVVDNTNGKAKYIDNNKMMVQEMDYQTYQYNTTGVDVEGQLTAAISYVTSVDLPIMYMTEGHGETAAGTSFTDAISKMNVETKTLSTVTADAIPEDCDILYINTPQKDLSDAETTIIKDYLTAGGKVIVNVDYNAADLKNLMSILDYYGIGLVKGIVLEGDKNHYISGYPHYVIPTIESHKITTQAKQSEIPVLMPVSAGLTISDTTRSSLTVTPLLTTSDTAYAKTNIQSTNAEKEDGDVAGPFYLGLAAEDTYNDVTSSLIVYSSQYTFGDEVATYGNASLLTGTVGYLAGDTSAVTVPKKMFDQNTVHPNASQQIAWGALTALGIPLVIFVTGAVICFKRRRK